MAKHQNHKPMMPEKEMGKMMAGKMPKKMGEGNMMPPLPGRRVGPPAAKPEGGRRVGAPAAAPPRPQRPATPPAPAPRAKPTGGGSTRRR